MKLFLGENVQEKLWQSMRCGIVMYKVYDKIMQKYQKRP